jgi:hypothetical protein
MPYDAQNQLLAGGDSRKIVESFTTKQNIIDKILTQDVMLRTLLIGLLFYIINDDLMRHALNKYRTIIPIGILQTLIFCILYIIISINIEQ